MIKKPQWKFVFLSMSAFLVVLVIIITGINIVNYHAVVQESDMLLSIMSENKGEFPMESDKMINSLPPDMSPEIPYESRYFSVTLDTEKDMVLRVETSRIISVDPEAAIEYAITALEQDKTNGFLGDFRYQIDTEDNYVQVTFLDCGRKIDAFYDFMFASILISLVGYFIVFALIAFFSNRIIRPISESYEKQKQFITNAGHEIKTPLTIIHADADVLEMEVGTNEWLDDIKKQANQLTELTNDLVFLSRMEESQSSISMIDFPFSEVVAETASSFQALAQTQEKEFLCNVQPMLSYHGNEKSIRQLVSILLDNAVKYTPSKGTISLYAEKQNHNIRLSVYNTIDYPIEKKQLKSLFDRFYRLDPSRNSKTGGHGIGLSIAQAITLAHDGKIQALLKDENTIEIMVVLPIK